MCGIAGWYRRSARPVDPAIVEAQCRTIIRRGPDDQGVLVDGDLGFGMRRLAVVDVAGGHQPMTSADGRFSVVFNGEIYNQDELRRELGAAGVRFRTRSDTEALLEGFAHWGPTVWTRLEGMFAAAVWDHRERTLHLARDPLGIKPLYWTLQDGGLAFASELKALVPVPGLTFVPDPEAIDQYVALGAVLAPGSIYRGISKLEPGTALELRAVGEPRLTRYWRLQPTLRSDLDENGWIEECRTRLLATVKSHLIADVPLGAFLSGGLDSAAVVAAMNRLGASPVHAFTIGFADPRYDETAAAARVAAHLGCRHEIHRLEPLAAAEILPRLATAFDEPFADDSAMPTWYVSRFARQQVTVALSGDGGDELFAGYRRHRAERLLQRLRRVPGSGALLAALARLPSLPALPGRRRRDRLARLAADSALDSTFARFFAKQCTLLDDERRALYQPGFAATLPGEGTLARWSRRHFPAPVSRDPVENLLYADTAVWLPDNMLTKVDRASMDVSLEVRVPLLAHRFVEWTATVPIARKLHRGVGKHLLRRAVAPWLPPGAVDLPKRGFSVPLAAWAGGDLGALVQTAWREGDVDRAGVFAPGVVDHLLAEHRAGARDHGRLLYVLLMFALWWRQRPTG